MLLYLVLVKFYLSSKIPKYFNPSTDIYIYNNKKDFTFLHLTAENNYLIISRNLKKI